MKNLTELVKDIERDLVINIVIGVRHKRLTLKESKDLSKSFMASFPFRNYNELFEMLYELSLRYKAARKVYVKYFPEFENEEKEKILMNMRNFIKTNDYENAIKAAKGGNYG
jgi:hypothetical protein